MTEYIRASLAWGLFWFAPVTVAAVALYFIITIPARRNERVRLFLDLLLGGIRDGRAPEELIVAISRTRDRSLGARLHLLAAYVEQGHRLFPALYFVPGFLPPHVIGILRAGYETSRMAQAIDSAKRAAGRAVGRTARSIHYAFVVLIVMLPFAALILPGFRIFIWPKIQAIMTDMEMPIPPFSALIIENSGWVLAAYAGLVLFALWLLVVQLSAPRLLNSEVKFFGIFAAMFGRFSYRLPWRRKLLQRDFSLTLAHLLDADVPETRAFALAGEATGNRFLVGRAHRIAKMLESGLPLPKAVAAFDDTGEFQWRLANALHTRGSFVTALRGWHEALESEAFKREEAVAHLTTTALLIMNGVVVALIASAMFLLFISAISEGVTW